MTPVYMHLLGRCSALAGKRRKQFGNHLFVPNETSCRRAAATICLRPLQVDNIFLFIRQVAQVDLWPFDHETGVQVTCDVGYLCANFSLPIGLSVLELGPMYTRQTSDRQTDVRQKHRLAILNRSIGAPSWVC